MTIEKAAIGIALMDTLSNSINQIEERARFEKGRFNAGAISRQNYNDMMAILHDATYRLLDEYNQVVLNLIELPAEYVGIEFHRRLTIYAEQLKRRLN